jgi:hypothetical protein
MLSVFAHLGCLGSTNDYVRITIQSRTDATLGIERNRRAALSREKRIKRQTTDGEPGVVHAQETRPKRVSIRWSAGTPTRMPRRPVASSTSLDRVEHRDGIATRNSPYLNHAVNAMDCRPGLANLGVRRAEDRCFVKSPSFLTKTAAKRTAGPTRHLSSQGAGGACRRRCSPHTPRRRRCC